MLAQAPKIISALEYYIELSAFYDDAAAVSPHFPKADNLYKIARPHMANNIRKVLDVGIGTGLSSKPFVADGRTVVGVDGSSQMLGKCIDKRIAQYVLSANFERAALPFRDGEFDMAFSANTLYLLSCPKNIIGDMIRVTRPGGLVAFNYEVSSGDAPEKFLNEAATQKPRAVYTYSQPQAFAAAVLSDHSMKVIAAQKEVVAYKCNNTPLVFETLVCRKPSL